MSLITKILLFSLFVPALSFAGTIKQVKNNKALLSLDGEPAKVGDQIYSLNDENKKVGLLEITTVKGDQAVAKIVKGVAEANQRTVAKPTSMTPAASGSSKKLSPTKPSFFRHDRIKMAVNLKVTMDSIASKQEDNTSPFPLQEEVTMSGTNFGINASLDYPMNSWLSLRGYAGYEILKAAGTAQNLSCDAKSSRDCNVNINYASFGALARLNYTMTNTQLWAGAGAGFKQPLSKSSTALKEDNIALANTALVALGIDYHLSNKYFIPASFEYHYSFNTSDTVPKISQMALLVGFGILF